uniref:rRNA N-glycosylase n=1 Tax=Oryza meridionalis TaxID=40149 RepID=A0A0E0E866_9ORYZ
MELQLARQTRRPHIQKRPVLGTQNYMPDCLIHVNVFLKGHGASTLAIRADNVYLVGFKTQGALWYVFKNRKNLIPGATALKFDDHYHSLTGRSYEDLQGVVVGKKSAQEALSILANYKQDGSIPVQEIKRALTVFVLMVCEAGRLVPIRTDVIAAWDQQDGGKVGKVAVDLTVKWKDISCALLIWDKTHKWGTISEAKKIKDFGVPEMKSPETAAANVYLILKARECSVPY